MTRQPRLSLLGNPRVGVAPQRLAPRPKVADPIYHTAAWRALIAAIISERGRRCEDRHCKTPGRTGMRVFGDHIKELQDGGALLDPDNVLLRCGSCHTIKSNAERAKRMATRW